MRMHLPPEQPECAFSLWHRLPRRGSFTRPHVVIPENSAYYLDVNHDGVYDFRISNYSGCSMSGCQPAPPGIGILSLRDGLFNLRSQGVEGHICCTLYALARGAQVSSKKSFLYGGSFNQGWHNHQLRYVGLQFQIKGQTHYGWARFKLDISPTSITVYLTGYAYETVVNKSIIAGRTHGSADADQSMSLPLTAPQPVMLGLLAQGSPALPIWRQKE